MSDPSIFSPEYSTPSRTIGESEEAIRPQAEFREQEVDHQLYGLNKPRRVITRGNIAAD